MRANQCTAEEEKSGKKPWTKLTKSETISLRCHAHNQQGGCTTCEYTKTLLQDPPSPLSPPSPLLSPMLSPLVAGSDTGTIGSTTAVVDFVTGAIGSTTGAAIGAVGSVPGATVATEAASGVGAGAGAGAGAPPAQSTRKPMRDEVGGNKYIMHLYYT